MYSLVFHSFTFGVGGWCWLGRKILKSVFKQFRTMRLSGNISAWRWSAVGVGG